MSTLCQKIHNLNDIKGLTRDMLKASFVSSFKPESQKGVGLELERIGLDKKTGRAIPIEGKRSVRHVLQELQARYGWTPVQEGVLASGLRKGESTITLEPGGQLELSTPPHESLDHAGDLEKKHIQELGEIGARLNILWSGLGVQPISEAKDLPWISKERYAIMRNRFVSTGTLGHSMMKCTSSTQVSFDYSSEEDAIRKMRLAMKLVPLTTAVFANSCIAGGRLTPFKNYRSHIWQNTDPDRCGLVAQVFEASFNFDRWIDYLLDVPVLFIERRGRLLGGLETTFRGFMNGRVEGYEATLADWELHQTSVFPDVRMRKWIEYRAIDRQEGALSFAAAALLKVLFYDPTSLSDATRLLQELDFHATRAALCEAAKFALQGRMGRTNIGVYAKELMGIVQESIRRNQPGRLTVFEKNTVQHLQDEFIAKQKCPSDILSEKYASGASIMKLIQESALKFKCADDTRF